MLNSSEPLIRLGRLDEALFRLQAAARIAPDKYEIWTNLGGVQIEIGDKRSALESLQKARSLAPERVQSFIASAMQAACALPN